MSWQMDGNREPRYEILSCYLSDYIFLFWGYAFYREPKLKFGDEWINESSLLGKNWYSAELVKAQKRQNIDNMLSPCHIGKCKFSSPGGENRTIVKANKLRKTPFSLFNWYFSRFCRAYSEVSYESFSSRLEYDILPSQKCWSV